MEPATYHDDTKFISIQDSFISTRLSLRWLPEEPFENTDTLVLMVGEWYVDLRVHKQSGKLDWAIAGQCLLEDVNPRQIVFTHDIDSHNNFNISDPCPFIPLPNGNDLETGTMRRPDMPGTPLTDYEEVWRYLPAISDKRSSDPLVAWILESDDGGQPVGQRQISKTFLGRIGDRYLALQQEQIHTRGQTADGVHQTKIHGGEVSARSEMWSGERWEKICTLGSNACQLPSISKGFESVNQQSWPEVGKKVTLSARQYIVRAFESGQRS